MLVRMIDTPVKRKPGRPKKAEVAATPVIDEVEATEVPVAVAPKVVKTTKAPKPGSPVERMLTERGVPYTVDGDTVFVLDGQLGFNKLCSESTLVLELAARGL